MDVSLFCEIPVELINKNIAELLRLFLKGTADSKLKHSYSRDVIFLEKYNNVDENIFIDGVKLVFEKRKYSEFAASIYLHFLFNKYDYSPEAVVTKFNDNIELLEDIYVWLELYNRNSDTDGSFLFEICKEDHDFLQNYIQSVHDNTSQRDLDDKLRKLRVFYNADMYMDIFDKIFKQLMGLSSCPCIHVPDIIRGLIVKTEGEDERTEKSIKWTRHFIDENAHNKDEMVCLFEAFSKCDMSQRIGHLEAFLRKNDDFETFKRLPLTPISYSWSGSAVPLYSTWIEFFENVLPLLSGLKFINHKKHIEQEIEKLRKRIIDEQISDIMHG